MDYRTREQATDADFRSSLQPHRTFPRTFRPIGRVLPRGRASAAGVASEKVDSRWMFCKPLLRTANRILGGVFQQGNQLHGIACWRQTSVAGADYRYGFVRLKMRQSISEGFGKIFERCPVAAGDGESQDGFAKAEYAIGGDF